MQDIYTLTAIAELFTMSEKEVNRYCIRHGELCLSEDGKRLMIYIPALDVYTSYLHSSHSNMVKSLQSNDYKIELDGTVLSVNSSTQSPFSYLLTEDCVDGMQTYFDLTDDIHTLVSPRRRAPLFVGHEKVISRLNEEMDEDMFMLPFNTLHQNMMRSTLRRTN